MQRWQETKWVFCRYFSNNVIEEDKKIYVCVYNSTRHMIFVRWFTYIHRNSCYLNFQKHILVKGYYVCILNAIDTDKINQICIDLFILIWTKQYSCTYIFYSENLKKLVSWFHQIHKHFSLKKLRYTKCYQKRNQK